MSLSDPLRALENSRSSENVHELKNKTEHSFHLVTSQIDPEEIRQKQKHIFIFKVLGVGSLVCIPVVINTLSRNHHATWSTTFAVMSLGFLSLLLYRSQSKLRYQVETACHQLGPGVKLRKKYIKDSPEVFQIFQEGHRYYYIKSIQTGEKRLVPKDKVLQDFDLAL